MFVELMLGFVLGFMAGLLLVTWSIWSMEEKKKKDLQRMAPRNDGRPIIVMRALDLTPTHQPAAGTSQTMTTQSRSRLHQEPPVGGPTTAKSRTTPSPVRKSITAKSRSRTNQGQGQASKAGG